MEKWNDLIEKNEEKIRKELEILYFLAWKERWKTFSLEMDLQGNLNIVSYIGSVPSHTRKYLLGEAIEVANIGNFVNETIDISDNSIKEKLESKGYYDMLEQLEDETNLIEFLNENGLDDIIEELENEYIEENKDFYIDRAMEG